MVIGIYSVYDKKANCYRYPMFVNSDGQAIRSFQEACNDSSTEMGKYPDDFSLYKNGTFDDYTGQLHFIDVLQLMTGTIAVVSK